MSSFEQTKMIVANAVNYVVEINEILNTGTRSGTPAVLELPSMLDRAYLMFHEAGTLPLTTETTTPGGK